MFNNQKTGKAFLKEADKLFEENKLHEGYEMLQKAAEAGYAEAQYQLGCSILEMKINRPLKEGVKWYEKAAAQNHLFAINNLAMCYQLGQGVDVDYTKAFELLNKAAELGDMMANYNIGQAYIFGLGVKKDILRGLVYVQKAANSEVEGCAHALNFLGQITEFGEKEVGIVPNRNKAVEWYAKAAQKGDQEAVKALQRLGVIEGNSDDEEIAKQFMGMWLHYDMSNFKDIVSRNLKFSAINVPQGVDYNELLFKDQDYKYFMKEMYDALQCIIINHDRIRCRIRKEEHYICDTIQNGTMISYELKINSGKIYEINKYIFKG